jgi:hypothetical protein
MRWTLGATARRRHHLDMPTTLLSPGSLHARPEGRIAVVTHWGAIYGLTWKSLENCEVLELRLSEFKDKRVLLYPRRYETY